MIKTRLRKSFLYPSEDDEDAADVIPDQMDEEGTLMYPQMIQPSTMFSFLTWP